ncbi:MAG: response regulator [Bacteroidetes bacterium]|nr:response regulator [Bacteroidota bacterium]
MRKQRILIVDDEREVCLLLENYLLRKNHLVSYSTTLTEAFAKFPAFEPTFLILDHNMPDGYGIENIQKFKELNNNLCVLIISAMSNLREDALAKGADFFLEKPIKLSTLNSIINGDN